MKDDLATEFLRLRNDLIVQMENGAIDKTEFIEKTHEYMTAMGFKPFKNTSSMTVEQGLCNYQYYNNVAKKLLIKAEDLRFKDGKESYRCYNEAQDNYRKKEETTMMILEIIEYKQVSAYPIMLKSAGLSGEMVEIVLLDYEKAIFHTMDKLIIGRLKRNHVFDETPRESIIHHYVNKKYTY